MLHDGKEAGAVGEVAGEFPDHRSAEFLRVDVIAFRTDGLAVVVADEETPLARWGIDPGNLRGGVPVAAVDRGLGGEAFLDIPVIEHAGVVPSSLRSAGGGLFVAVVDIRHSFPTAAVEGQADDEFVGRHAAGEVGIHRGGGGERVAGRSVEGGLVVGLRLPGAVEVVGHDIDPIQNGGDFCGFDVGDFVGAGGRGDGEVIAAAVLLARGVELAAKLGEERGEVLFVLGTRDIGFEAPAAWVFPIDVHAVEAVFADERDGGGGEFAARGGRERGVGEAARERPAADRDHGDEVGILGFEFLELVEIPAQRLVPCVAGVGFFHRRVGIK